MKRVLHRGLPWLCLAVMATAATGAWPQAYPVRPVRLVLPGPAAGGVDIITRPIAKRLTELTGQQFLVDNRPGAGGLIAGEIVSRAAPDGYTALIGTSGTHSIQPLLAQKPPYDLVRDFSPVMLIATAPLMSAVHPSLPVRSVRELIGLAKAKPGEILYASNGTGTIQHLTAVMLCEASGISMRHVPYKGGTPAVLSVMSGHVQLVITALPTVLGQVRASRLRALAVTAAKRSLAAPEVPTFAESGVPGFVSEQWFSVFTPAGVPPSVTERFSAELQRAVGGPEVKTALHSEGAEIVAAGPAQLAEFHRADLAKWRSIISRTQPSRD